MSPSEIPSPRIQIGTVPQIVPSQTCLACDVCCRFPDQDSFLRPYFTGEEIGQAVAHGLDPARFPDPQGSHVTLVPHPAADGFLCPAFDPETAHCRIYAVRPLDCQLYPLAIMWDEAGRRVLLGWDTKCPFLRSRGGTLEETDAVLPYSERVAERLERGPWLEHLVRHPRLIGRFQDDVVVLRSLPTVTKRLLERASPGRPATEPQSCIAPGAPARSGPAVIIPGPALRRLAVDDYPRFMAVLERMPTPLATFGLACHLMWQDTLSYSWMELNGDLCLFAEYVDGTFMPLPPLGTAPASRSWSAVFGLMRDRNHGSAVTRVENVPEEWAPVLERLGYRLAPKDPEYLYEATTLVALAGDRYKAQRAACNRFAREQGYRYGPYETRHADACLALYQEWAAQKGRAGLDPVGHRMLEDAAAAHAYVLRHAELLGLTGRTVWIEQRLVAYTFGYARHPSVFCVLLEVTDRTRPGLAAVVFRDFCRDAVQHGFTWINTMDDSGLVSLRRSKLGYRPVRLVASYVATES